MGADCVLTSMAGGPALTRLVFWWEGKAKRRKRLSDVSCGKKASRIRAYRMMGNAVLDGFSGVGWSGNASQKTGKAGGCGWLRKGVSRLRGIAGAETGGDVSVVEAEAGEAWSRGMCGGSQKARGLSCRARRPQARPLRLLNDGKQLEGLNEKLSFASVSPPPPICLLLPLSLFLDKKQKQTDLH